MGAYENPAMIRDTSGQYIYQGLAGFGAGIAKGMNDYAARNELRRKEMAALAKEEQIKKDALTTDAWKSYDDWSKDLRKSLGPDVSEEVLLNTNRYATEHQQEYLDAYKNRALATTTEQRTSAQSQIDKFNERAGLTVKASTNYIKTSQKIKDMATKSGATWTSPNDQFAWTLMNNGRAGLEGVENYNVRTEYLDNGHTQLVLDAQIKEGADLTIPGIDVKDGRFTYKVDLNKLNTSNVIATGFEEMDPLETARSLNIVDKDNAFNTRQNQVVFENAKQKVGFYNSAGFLDSMKQQVSAEVNSWWSTSDPETLSKIKATLKGWGMSPTEVDAAIKLGSKSTEEGSMQDALLDRQVSSIFKNGLVGIVDEDVIKKINKINEGRSDEEKFQVPALNDKYVYSVQTVEPVKETPTKTTEAQLARQNIEKSLSNMKEIDFSTPDNFISYYNKGGYSSYGRAVTGDKILDQLVKATDTRGNVLDEYDYLRNALNGAEGDTTTLAQRRAIALKKMKEKENIGANTVMLFSGTGTEKNRFEADNKTAAMKAILRAQGYSDDDISTVFLNSNIDWSQHEIVQEQTDQEDN
jgi:hypothetical protein